MIRFSIEPLMFILHFIFKGCNGPKMKRIFELIQLGPYLRAFLLLHCLNYNNRFYCINLIHLTTINQKIIWKSKNQYFIQNQSPSSLNYYSYSASPPLLSIPDLMIGSQMPSIYFLFSSYSSLSASGLLSKKL